jgi:hypothetical protein
MAPKTYWEESAKKLGMEDIVSDEKAVGIRLKEDHNLIEKSRSAVEKLFVPMGEEKSAGKSDDGNAEEENDEVMDEEGKSEESNEATKDDADEENNIEKADQETEEILAQL